MGLSEESLTRLSAADLMRQAISTVSEYHAAATKISENPIVQAAIIIACAIDFHSSVNIRESRLADQEVD